MAIEDGNPEGTFGRRDGVNYVHMRTGSGHEGAVNGPPFPLVPVAVLLLTLAAVIGLMLSGRAPEGVLTRPRLVAAETIAPEPTVDAPAAPVAALTPEIGARATLSAAIPAGVTELVADPSYTPARCTTEFAGLLEGRTINFTTASAEVDPASKPLLDRLALLAGRCSGGHITVDGHTDSVGPLETNMALSRDRAAAVATYLIGKGVRPAQLAAVGYGQSRMKEPTADNTENAANRRIEITVTN